MEIYKRYLDESTSVGISTQKAIHDLSGHFDNAESLIAQIIREGITIRTPFCIYGASPSDIAVDVIPVVTL